MPANIFRKIDKLWNKLNLPEEGPEYEVTSRDEEKTHQSIQSKIKNNSTMYRNTAHKWAYGLFDHCKKNKIIWYEELIENHRRNGTLEKEISLHSKHFKCEEIINNLFNYNEMPEARKSNVEKTKNITFSEYTWLKILEDNLSEESFDFIFVLKNIKKENYSDATDLDLDLIKSIWQPNFDCEDIIRRRFEGFYLMYRSETVTPPELNEENDIPYGWLGKQKVRVIPVKIKTKNRALIWLDCYPDIDDYIHESIGAIATSEVTGNYHIYGVDKENHAGNKYWGSFGELDDKSVSRGIIIANNRYDKGGTEVYPFWLQKVTEAEYRALYNYVQELRELFKDDIVPNINKRNAYYNNREIFITVRELLEQKKVSLVYYLFLNPSITHTKDQLIYEDRVREVGYNDIQKTMNTSK